MHEPCVYARKLKGFRWRPGMAVLHVGAPLRNIEVQEDEFLGEPFIYLMCIRPNDATYETHLLRDEGETFPDLSDPLTDAYCRLAQFTGEWYEEKP